jgi:squalene synthase HpnC
MEAVVPRHDRAGPDGPEALLLRLADGADAQMGAENFPVALRVLPRRPRAALSAVYRYARFVDDVGDRADCAPSERLALLDVVDREVRALPDGNSRLHPVAGLASVVREHGIANDLLLDLVEANRLDQRKSSYATFDELLDYCRLSAAPVGRIVLHVAGAVTEANVADSDTVCAALQVLEHCQDVGEDARAGRIYLPAADLRTAAVHPDQLLAPTTAPGVRRVVALNVARAEHLLSTGGPLVGRLSGWARFAVAGYVAGGWATSAALRGQGYDVLARDIRPSRLRTAARMTRLLLRRSR